VALTKKHLYSAINAQLCSELSCGIPYPNKDTQKEWDDYISRLFQLRADVENNIISTGDAKEVLGKLVKGGKP